MANQRLKLSMPAPLLGIEERDAHIRQGQLKECVNLLPIDGELRTRGGQRWRGTAAPVIECSWENGGVIDDAALVIVAGQTRWHMAPRLDDVGNRLEIAECSWKCLQFYLIASTAAAFVDRTVTFSYYSTQQAAWVVLPYAFPTDYTSTTLFSELYRVSYLFQSYLSQHVVLNTSSSAPLGSDVFFDDWGAQTIGGRTHYWIRIDCAAGAAANVTITGGAVAPVRPMAMQHYVTRAGVSQLVVHTGYPVGRGGQDNSGVAPAYDETDRQVEFFHQPYIRRGGAAGPPWNAWQAVTTSLYTNAHLHFESTGWQSRVEGTALNPHAGRVRLPSEAALYIDLTQRMLVTSHGGVASMVIDEGRQRQLTGTRNRNRGFPTLEQYPYATTLPARYNTIPLMRHLGRPWAVAFHDGAVFFGYSSGLLRWSYPLPLEDMVSDLGFVYLSDDDGHRVMALVPFGSYLVALLENSIWVIEPAGEIEIVQLQGYFARKVVSGTGLAGTNAWCVAEGLLYFLSHDGVYVFNGGSVQRISGPLEHTFARGLAKPALRNACMAFDKKRRQVWIGVCRTGSFWNDLVLVYNLPNPADESPAGWFMLEGVEAEHLVYDDNDELLYSCDSRGNVFQQDFGRGDGATGEYGIAWRLETGPLLSDFIQGSQGELHLFLRHYSGSAYESAVVVDGVERDVETWDADRRPGRFPRTDTIDGAWDNTDNTNAHVFAGIAADHFRRKFAVPLSWNAEDLAFRLRSSSTSQPGAAISILSMELRLANAGPSRGP